MNISISATNPCHLWPLAQALARTGSTTSYYSGYPKWRLPDRDGVHLHTHPFRTVTVYGLLRFVPEKWRPSNQSLFRWQDHAFDRWVGRTLSSCDFIHALPGQALHTFQRAKSLGIHTVLNHATGPVKNLNAQVLPEYERLGMKLEDHSVFDEAYLERERREYELSDFHCVASSLVRDQLVQHGVAPENIWLVPYGADESVWHPPTQVTDCPKCSENRFRVLFAGQLSLRKGLRFLLEALTLAGDRNWQLDCYGPILDETGRDRADYKGSIPVHYHGPVSATSLAEVMRNSDVLVLPSLEEGFGLVVLQALACGLPCIVSDAVGAKDLLAGNPERGDIFSSGKTAEILSLLAKHHSRWLQYPEKSGLGSFCWMDSASKLLEYSETAFNAHSQSVAPSSNP